MNETIPKDLVSAALVECQGKLKAANMDATNPFFKSRYATLGAVIEASRAALFTSGLAILQTVDIKEGMVSVNTSIVHKSGQWLSGGTCSLAIGENERNSDAQFAGSIITYLRRYAWATVLGIYADEDSDGNDAPKGSIKRPVSQVAASPRPPTQNSPQSQPSVPGATSGGIASDKERLKALNSLQGAPGQSARALVTDFLRSKKWIGADQQPESWRLDRIPATQDQMLALSEELARFEMQQREEGGTT